MSSQAFKRLFRPIVLICLVMAVWVYLLHFPTLHVLYWVVGIEIAFGLIIMCVDYFSKQGSSLSSWLVNAFLLLTFILAIGVLLLRILWWSGQRILGA